MRERETRKCRFEKKTTEKVVNELTIAFFFFAKITPEYRVICHRCSLATDFLKKTTQKKVKIMKKILMTAAALSVAGTAFANADTVVLTGGLSSGILSSSNSRFQWDTNTYGTSFDNWEVTFNLTLTSAPNSNGDKIFSTSRSNGGGSGSMFQVNSDGTVQWVGGDRSESAWATVGGPALSVTLSYDGSTLTAKNGSGDSVTLVATGAALTSDSSTLWTNGAKETFSGITVKKTSAVPEPSAFGLLAGMGALALVASRRRRR